MKVLKKRTQYGSYEQIHLTSSYTLITYTNMKTVW